MDKLERYLDQVVRSIAGPRSLRQHVRQELREHLLDAASHYRAGGISEDESVERALRDFGGPEQVRSELEAAHGHRLMGVVIDKAMQWKEHTMKAKWIWTSWAHVALALLIAAEVSFIALSMVFVMPKVQQIVRDAGVDIDACLPRARSFLACMRWAADYGLWCAILLAAGWALFEWRVRSENKTLIRLSAMATAALGMMLVVFMTAAVMAIPLAMAAPMLNARLPEHVVGAELAGLDSSLAALDQAIAIKDWDAIDVHAGSAFWAMNNLSRMGAAAPALASLHEQRKIDELRAKLMSAKEYLRDAWNAGGDKDTERLGAAMRKFHAAFADVQGATTRPAG